MTYKEALTAAMAWLSDQPQTIFMGQSVVYPGHALYGTLEDVPKAQRLELPVAEELQMGMSIGYALQGYTPISIYPRMDFLIVAMNQLVNHLDKIALMSEGQFQPKVIIRTAVGAKTPLYPGVQHCQNHIDGLRAMLQTTAVIHLQRPDEIFGAYMRAYTSQNSTILVEEIELYDT